MNNRYTKGFTLIEAALMLVLLGVVLSALISYYSNSLKERQTKQQIEANEKGAGSIIAFAQLNGYLPQDLDTLATIWKRNDTFNTDYGYIVTPELAAGKQICSLSAGATASLSMRYCEDEACTQMTLPVPNIAFLLISRGRNMQQNHSVVGNEYRLLRNKENLDDIASYYTMPELWTLAGCDIQTANPNKLKFAVDAIMPLRVNGSGTVPLLVKGGTPFTGNQYRWCIDSFVPKATNFLANRLQFQVKNSTSYLTLNDILTTSCASDASFKQGGDILFMKYNEGALISGTGTSGSFFGTVYVKDNTTPTPNLIQKRFLFQLYQK